MTEYERIVIDDGLSGIAKADSSTEAMGEALKALIKIAPVECNAKAWLGMVLSELDSY